MKEKKDRKDQIASDLQRDLRIVLNDAAAVCEDDGIADEEAVIIAISSLMYEVIRIAIAMRMDKSAFMRIAGISYRQFQPMVETELEEFGGMI